MSRYRDPQLQVSENYSYICLIWDSIFANIVYGYYTLFNYFSVGTVFRRQNLTSLDVRFWPSKDGPLTEGVNRILIKIRLYEFVNMILIKRDPSFQICNVYTLYIMLCLRKNPTKHVLFLVNHFSLYYTFWWIGNWYAPETGLFQRIMHVWNITDHLTINQIKYCCDFCYILATIFLKV